MEKYETHQNICKKCDLESVLQIFSDICSVYDLYEIEFECIKTNIRFPPLFEIELNISKYIKALVGKARNDYAFRKKFKLVQRNALMFLYFMQYIKERRKTSQCMKFFKLSAEKISATEI